MALLGGLGAAAYQAALRSYSLDASAGRVQGVIRAARNTAVSTGTPAFVVVDPLKRRVSAYSYERVGEWSFDNLEGPVEGLTSRAGANRGGETADGRVGKGLDFGGKGHFDCGSLARYDLRTAVSIEAWVRHASRAAVKPSAQEVYGDLRRGRGAQAQGAPVRAGRGRSGAPARGAARLVRAGSAPDQREEPFAIVEKPGAYFLGMTASGALEGRIGAYRARTASGVVPPGKWVFVSLRYDGSVLELGAEGVPRKTWTLDEPRASAGRLKRGAEEVAASSTALPAAAPVTREPLTISSPAAPFPGVLDEVSLGGNVEPLIYEYDEFEHVVGWKKVIHFDRSGHLDARHHPGEVRLVLVELTDEETSLRETTVAVDFSVTFAEWLGRWDEPPDLIESVEESKLEFRFRGRRNEIRVDRLGVITAARLEARS